MERARQFQIQEAPGKEKVVRPPFIIRGHHVGEYLKLVAGTRSSFGEPWTPKEVAREQAKYELSRWRQLLYHPRPGDEPEVLYWKDVSGTNWRQRRRRRIEEERLLRQFVELPDDYPVELVSGRKDALCGVCVVGEHCTTSGPKFGKMGSTRLQRDERSVQTFLFYARTNGFGDDVNVTTKVTDFIDMEQKEALVVQTTADTFKNVLRQYPLYW